MKLGNKQLVEKLTRSAIYRDYVRAFSAATGMPLALRAVEHWQPALRGAANENPFCELMARSNRVCAACLEVQRKLTEKTGDRSRTVTCFAGLSDSAVPIRVGDQLIGFLQTGLLEIFGRHLSILSNQLATESSSVDPPAVTRAKQFIARNQDNAICLATVAKAVNTSTFYFCKLFKRATGLTFTEYLARVRIEKAKTLLLDPNQRVSEVAYEVGFQSLTHFNRVFRGIVRQSPTSYRRSFSKLV